MTFSGRLVMARLVSFAHGFRVFAAPARVHFPQIFRVFPALAVTCLLIFVSGCHHAPSPSSAPSPRSETPPIAIDGAFRERLIGLDPDFFEDTTRAMKLQDVRAPEHAAQFVPSVKAAPNFGYTHSAWWARFSLDDRRNPADHARADPLELTLAYAQTDFAELWCENAAGAEVVHARAGDHVLLAEWPSDFREPSFAIPAGARTCFLRVESGASLHFPLTLRTREAFAAHRLTDTAVQCLYFGALLVMIAYNGLVAVATRSAAYALYTLFLVSYGLLQSALSGFGYALLWPDAVGWADRAAPLSVAATGATALLFAARLLDLAHTSPRLWALTRILLAVVCLCVCATGFVPYSVAVRLMIAPMPVWALVLFAAGGLQSWRGVRVAKLYLVAWTVFILGTLINVLRVLGVVPTNLFTVNAQQVGSAIEFVLLSFALADRIKTLQADVATQAHLAAANAHIAADNAKLAAHNANLARIATQHALDEQARANAELTRLDRLKDEFLANTSHELRTPLNGVIGLADSLLAESAGVPNTFRQGLRTILASGRRLDRLVSDLMDFAKAKSGELTIEFTGVDLQAAAAESCLVLAAAVGDKELALVNDVGRQFPLALADETRFSQVLLHVVGNAIKFSEQGEVRISAVREAEQVLITVADTGPGMSEETLARVFTVFEQGDGSATRAQGGTGLGLPFVQQLMALQLGSVSIASTLGKGTRVTLTLAVASPEMQSARRYSVTKLMSVVPVSARSIMPSIAQIALPRPGAPVGLRGLAPLLSVAPTLAQRRRASTGGERLVISKEIRVLIADDEPMNLERLELDFKHTGYDIVCVNDGQAAVDAYQNDGPFDLVLLDVMMPRLDGLAACRAIRAFAGAHEVPILLITAKRETKDLEAGFAAGANDYLTKPYVRQELLERSRSHIETARMARAVHHFVPKEFAALLGHPRVDQIALGDCVEKNMTILFLDIQGYTKAAEKMTSREVFNWLNGQFHELVPAMRAHGGFVDKFVGDAIMALFPEDALAAVDAASEAVQRLRTKFPLARIGVGLHHGATMVGAIGDAGRFSPTVVSDAVNVASRLENLTRRFHACVLVSTEVFEAAGLRPGDRTRYLGAFRVKGRSTPLGIHELLDAEDPIVAAEKRSANELLSRLHRELAAGEIDGAWATAEEGAELYPDDAVLAFYRVAIESMMRLGLPYDGSFELKDKT